MAEEESTVMSDESAGDTVIVSAGVTLGKESSSSSVSCLYLCNSSEVGIPRVERTQSHPVSVKTSAIVKKNEIFLFIIF